jgi:hypothetical protein
MTSPADFVTSEEITGRRVLAIDDEEANLLSSKRCSPARGIMTRTSLTIQPGPSIRFSSLSPILSCST